MPGSSLTRLHVAAQSTQVVAAPITINANLLPAADTMSASAGVGISGTCALVAGADSMSGGAGVAIGAAAQMTATDAVLVAAAQLPVTCGANIYPSGAQVIAAAVVTRVAPGTPVCGGGFKF